MTDTDRINWLEKETNKGACYALVNDDNGHWAVATQGSQSVSYGKKPMDVSTTFWIKAKQWKNTIRQALDAAMKEQEEP